MAERHYLSSNSARKVEIRRFRLAGATVSLAKRSNKITGLKLTVGFRLTGPDTPCRPIYGEPATEGKVAT